MGAARRLLPGEVTPEAVWQEVSALLDQPAWRAAAGRLAREIGQMPGLEQAVALMEELAQIENVAPTATEHDDGLDGR